MPVVTIQLENDDTVPERISGAVIEFYETDGTFLTSGTSDVDGEVTVTLPAADYDVLFFKAGMSVLPKQPQRITVLTQVDPNVFLVTAHQRVLPESADPTVCKVSGYVINSFGKPQKGVKFTIGACFELVVDHDRLLDPDHMISVVTDDTGYVEFDLLRGQNYEVFALYKEMWVGMPPGRLRIKSPDQAAVKLHHLLFPIPVFVEFSPGTVSVAVAARDESTTLTVTYADGNARKCPLEWGTYKLVVSDDSIFEYEVADDTIIIIGKAAGTATLTAERILPTTQLWNPPPDFVTETLTVTVA